MAFRPALLCFAALLAVPAWGAEISGVRLEERVRAGSEDLELNGFGLRTRLIFEVYVAGLYLPQRTQSAEAAIAMPGSKRMTLVMLRDVDAGQFSDALLASLARNVPEAELAALKPEVDDMLGRITRIGEAKKGTVIQLDYSPRGTSISVNGAQQGKPIEGEAFFRALLRTWLGQNPAQEDLKKALLGQGG